MKEKKKILVISQYFFPETFRINDICLEWVRKGYEVTVVTGIPNYPAGKFYKGYGLIKKRKELWNGINIIRIPIISRGKSSFRLALNYISFVISGFFWKLFTRVKADKVFIYEVSPMTQALVGVWFAKRRKVPCYIYVTDLWPENFEIVTGIHNRLIVGPIERMVKYIYQNCQKIFISSRGFQGSIEDKGIEVEKIIYWPQYAEDFYMKKSFHDISEHSLKIYQSGRFQVLFAGNIGEAQGLEVLVQAAAILKKKNTEHILFCLVGDGRYKDVLKTKVKEYEVENMFSFYSRVSAQEIPDLFAQVDASIISLSKSEVFSLTVPAKTQSCLACGKPILVVADGEVQNIIREAECGFVCDSGDANSLAENIISMFKLSSKQREDMGIHAVKYYQEHFCKTKLLNQMDEYLGN